MAKNLKIKNFDTFCSYFRRLSGRRLLIPIMIFCLYPILLWAQNLKTSDSFLVITDIHLSPTTHHAMEFSPQENFTRNDLDVDTYKKLTQTLHNQIQSGVIQKPQFILLLGDLVVHGAHTEQTTIHAEQIVFAILKQYFPDTPILYTFGNNDSLVKNYGDFQKKGGDPLGSPVDVMKTIWPEGSFLSTGTQCNKNLTVVPCIRNANSVEGYYSAVIKQGIRLISLNTVLFSHHNDRFDPEGDLELQWFAKEMNQVRLLHEQALVVMHIPPGYVTYQPHFWSDKEFWHQRFLKPFLKIIAEYDGHILGILAAHTHKDELKIIRTHKTHVLTSVLINPALSTSHGNAPGVRAYRFSRHLDQSWHLDDYETYFFTKSNHNEIDLKPLYRFREIYCPTEQGSMNQCLQHFDIKNMQRFLMVGNESNGEIITKPQTGVYLFTH